MTKQRISKFQTGSGCYTCRMCHKQTRASGFDASAAGCGLCEACYDRATWANSHEDGNCYECEDERHAAGECWACDMEKLNAERLAQAIKDSVQVRTDTDHGGIPMAIVRGGLPKSRLFPCFWASWEQNTPAEHFRSHEHGILVTDANTDALLADAALPWPDLRDKYPDMVQVDAQALQ